MSSTANTPPKRQHQLQAVFAAYLRDPDNNPPPEGIEERRLAIYRRLFFGNLRNLMAKNFPVLRRLLDDVQWNRLIRDLMVEHRSMTPMFPEIGAEMLAFLCGPGEEWLQERPWMAELAQWEYMETLARLHESKVAESAPAADHVLERSIALNPTVQMARFYWPVNRISPSFIPDEPLIQPLNLLAFRRYDDEVAFERVNDLSLRFLHLSHARPGSTGLEVLTILAEETGIAPLDSVIKGGEKLVIDFLNRQLITLSRGKLTG